MKKVMIIFGGNSSEHVVSCNSAIGIYNNLDKSKYECYMVGITREGKWLLTDATPEMIKDGSWIYSEGNHNITLLLDEKNSGFLVYSGYKLEELKVDCIFSIIHGKKGEDGSLQGMLEFAGIPYVGPGIAASAIGFDKALTKEFVNSLNINQADCVILNYESDEHMDEYCDKVKEHFNGEYPIFVKPSREGSSVGISKVNNEDELKAALLTGFKYDKKLVVEKGIVGREIEIAVLGSDKPAASPIGEILVDQDFYSYDAKYSDNSSKTAIVNDIDPELTKEIQEAALAIYKKLECKGLSRVDFFLQEDGTYVFNEINTLPGFTPISMYPKLWEAAGISYSELISLLIEDAIKTKTFR